MNGVTLPWATSPDCLLITSQNFCAIKNSIRPSQVVIAEPTVAAAECVKHLLGLCLVPAVAPPQTPIFSFAIFITALTLIGVVFTISDVRFKFRIAVAPIPLVPVSFALTAMIGASV